MHLLGKAMKVGKLTDDELRVFLIRVVFCLVGRLFRCVFEDVICQDTVLELAAKAQLSQTFQFHFSPRIL